MLKSLRRYAKAECMPPEPIEQGEVKFPPVVKDVTPIIRETGNMAQIRSLLVLREAKLLVAKAQLTGNDRIDWYARNRILNLETKIADLRRWLAEAMGQNDES